MTLAAATFPLALPDALQFLRDALGDNYGASTDDQTLTRALGVDAVSAPTGEGGAAQAHARPWATAARLIRWNTEYEVSKNLNARIDRKLQQLDAQQAAADAQAGITDVVAETFGADDGRCSGSAHSGSLPTRAVW